MFNKRSPMCDVLLSALIAGVLYTACGVPQVEAQNTTCATRPAGDDSNACASTAYVQNSGIPAIPIEKFGGGCSTEVADNTTALLAAVASVSTGVRIMFPQNCTYKFVGTDLITFTKAVMLEGAGQYHTVLQYSPSASGTFLNWSNGVNTIYGGNGAGLKDMSLSIGPSVYATNMVAYSDVSGFTVDNVNIGWGYGGVIGSGSTCIYTKGREFGWFSNLNLQCDRPLRIGQNPNSYGAADFFDFRNLFLNASATYPAVTVDDGGTIGNTTFDNISMPQGTYGFYWPGLGARSAVAAVTSAGSGYTVNVPVTLTGGTCSTAIQVRPLTVNGNGGILTASIANPGVCTVVPSNPVSAVSGGAAFTLDDPISYRLTFNNIRTEQADNYSAYSFYIAPKGILYGLTISNTVMDSYRCGIYLRNTREVTIEGVNHLYVPATCDTSVNADASNDIITYTNNYWMLGHTQSILQIPVRYDASPTGTSTTIPPSAYYNTTFEYTYAQSLGVIEEFKHYGSAATVTLTVPGTIVSNISNVWGSAAGTIVTTATAPLQIDALTGAVSCPTCGGTTVDTVATAANAYFYPLFVASTADSAQIVNLDASGLAFNPFTNTLSVGTAGLYSFGGTANISGQSSGNSMSLTSILNNVSSGIGILFLPNITSSSAISMYGRRMTVASQADANTTALFGDYVILDTTVNNASTLTNSTGYLIGQRLQGSSTAANVITASIGLNIAATAIGGFSGSNLTISNIYGDKIDNQGTFCSTAAVTCGPSYALYVSAQTNADATAYAIFTAGAGLARISDTTASTSSTVGAITTDGGIGVAKELWVGTYIATTPKTVGTLPACAAGTKSARMFVTDANATFTAGIGAVVAAGGANNVPVTCDGTNWRIGANDNVPSRKAA